MKRFIILLFFCLSMTVNAQDIKYRRLLEQDGLDIMTSTLDVPSNDRFTVHYALQYEDNPAEYIHKSYYLIIRFYTYDNKMYIPQKGLLLLKTIEGNVLQLSDCGTESFREYSIWQDCRETTYRSSYCGHDDYGPKYVVQDKFPISENDLHTLMNEGVIKLRIQTTKGAIDCSYNETQVQKNKTAIALTKLYNLIASNINPYYDL